MSFVPMTKDTLAAGVSNIYALEGCGICEKDGAEVFWFSPHSRCAHAKCIKMIEALKATLIKQSMACLKQLSARRKIWRMSKRLST